MKNHLFIVIALCLLTSCEKDQTIGSSKPADTQAKNDVAVASTTKTTWGDSSLFEKSQTIIFHNDFNSLNKHLITVIDADNTHLTAQSEGTDPTLTFSEINISQGKEYILRVNITSPAKSELQLFYSVLGNTGYPFSEENSVRVPISIGENDIYIHLANQNLDKFLRLDPTSINTSFTISELTLKEIN